MLYKYLPPKRSKTLTEFYPWFSHVSQLNDPYEFIPNFQLRPEDHIMVDPPSEPSDGAFLWKAMAPMVRQRLINRFHHHLNAVGVCCFTHDPSNLLMWSHYAEVHTGMVLGFGEDSSFFAEVDTPEGCVHKRAAVRYARNRSPVSPRDAFAATTINDVLLTKPVEWAYEREVRLIAQIKSGDRRCPYPPESLREVIFGMRSDKGWCLSLREKVRARAPWIQWKVGQLAVDEFAVTHLPLPEYRPIGTSSELIYFGDSLGNLGLPAHPMR